jgi:hypothetical protein
MVTRFLTLLVAAAMALATQAQAQAPRSDRALNYILGQWGNSEGRTIEFYISRDIPKFSDSYGPGNTYVGSYDAGKGGADYVLEYPNGTKCYYNLNITAGELKEIVFALRNAVPEGDERFCIRGSFRKLSDRR